MFDVAKEKLKENRNVYFMLMLFRNWREKDFQNEICNFVSLQKIESSNHPKAYAKDGKEMEWLYLSDKSCAHTPYAFSACRVPKYIIWDRNNGRLSRHVYTYENIFHLIGHPKKKFAIFLEGCEIIPRVYDRLLKNIAYLEEFDAVFTNQEILLDSLSNSYFIPSCSPWYGTENGGGNVDKNGYKKKIKNVSIVSSDKEMCSLHILRKSLALQYDKFSWGGVDCFGTFNGKDGYVPCFKYLQDYRFHIAVENQVSNGYFTEKITNCFLSMTVPIYIGAPDIGKYFNTDGIIQIEEASIEAVNFAVENYCNEENYEKRIPAIIDNYNRVQSYLVVEDYLYNNYFDILK